MYRYNAFNRALTGSYLIAPFARTNVRRRTGATPVVRLPQAPVRGVIDRDSLFTSPRPSTAAGPALG